MLAKTTRIIVLGVGQSNIEEAIEVVKEKSDTLRD